MDRNTTSDIRAGTENEPDWVRLLHLLSRVGQGMAGLNLVEHLLVNANWGQAILDWPQYPLTYARPRTGSRLNRGPSWTPILGHCFHRCVRAGTGGKPIQEGLQNTSISLWAGSGSGQGCNRLLHLLAWGRARMGKTSLARLLHQLASARTRCKSCQA